MDNFSHSVSEHLSWDALEHPKYERGKIWYVFAFLISAALLIYTVVSVNFLFALILILCILVLYLVRFYEPKLQKVSITDSGIVLGNTLHPYKEMRRFWLVYEPGMVERLYIELSSGLHPRLTVDISNVDPNELRTVLSNFLEEDTENDQEPISDMISRWLKI